MKVLLALLTATCLLSGIALAAGGTAEDILTPNPPSESVTEPPVETDMGASVNSGEVGENAQFAAVAYLLKLIKDAGMQIYMVNGAGLGFVFE